MSLSVSSSSISAQDLLNALIELRKFIEQRQLNFTDIFGDSKRFSSFMSDLHPELDRKIQVISALIDAGYLKRLQDAPANGRATIAGNIKVWLDEKLMLRAEVAQAFCSALLAFYNGKTTVAEAGSLSVSPQAPAPPPPSPGPGVSSAAEDSFAKGAMLYVKGKHREAADWYRQAASQGNADAQYMLGNMYRDGDGVEKDWRQAEELYLKAAAQGHAEARQALRQLMVADSASPSAAPSQSAPLKPYRPLVPVAPSLRDVYANKGVGEYFDFGRYPQGPNGEIKPITWRVLRRDFYGLLVIAEHGLDAKPYNEKMVKPITWADCTLRRWLNGEFFNKAFNEQEQFLIKTSFQGNGAEPSTDDRVFLLSSYEARNFFVCDGDRIIKPTVYAIKSGADEYRDGNAWWWLRSGAIVSDGGVLDQCGASVNYDGGCVRPVLRLDIFGGQDDCFEFGRYPQGPNGEIKPITWRVLQRNSDSLLVIAERSLDAKPYNEDCCDITWANCTLRRWLNGEFLQKAFNGQEQSFIKTSHLSNNVGPSTDDRVFLLSVDEADRLFADYDERICQPTVYAADEKGAHRCDSTIFWWLRSSSSDSNCAVIVDHDGSLHCPGFRVDHYGVSVRPACILAI